MDRLTVRKKMEGLPFEEGKHGSKDYDSATALRALYLGKGEDGEVAVSGQEAQRLLAVARTREIELGMEVTRKERIPLDDVAAVNEEVFGNVSALLKSRVGKPFTDQDLRDLLAEIRSVADKLTV